MIRHTVKLQMTIKGEIDVLVPEGENIEKYIDNYVQGIAVNEMEAVEMPEVEVLEYILKGGKAE